MKSSIRHPEPVSGSHVEYMDSVSGTEWQTLLRVVLAEPKPALRSRQVSRSVGNWKYRLTQITRMTRISWSHQFVTLNLFQGLMLGIRIPCHASTSLSIRTEGQQAIIHRCHFEPTKGSVRNLVIKRFLAWTSTPCSFRSSRALSLTARNDRLYPLSFPLWTKKQKFKLKCKTKHQTPNSKYQNQGPEHQTLDIWFLTTDNRLLLTAYCLL